MVQTLQRHNSVFFDILCETIVLAKKNPAVALPPPVGGRDRELVLLGGNANNGANCGLGYVNSNNAFSNSNANYGSRHT